MMKHFDRFIEGAEKFWQIVFGALAVYLERAQPFGEHETVFAIAFIIALQAYITRNGSNYTFNEVLKEVDSARQYEANRRG